MPQITTSKRTVTKSYKVPFEIRGNIDSPVKKYDEKLGDGNIDTLSAGLTVYVSADLVNKFALGGPVTGHNNERCVKMILRYSIIEDKWNEKGYGSRDYFYINVDSYYIPVNDFFCEGNYEEKDSYGRVIKSSKADIDFLSGQYQLERFYAARYFKGGMPLKYRDYTPLNSGEKIKTGVQENCPNWLYNVEVKMDGVGTGSALEGKGTLAIKGIMEFTLVRTDEITEYTYSSEPKMGDQEKVEQFHSRVEDVLGRGYDICGDYASVEEGKGLKQKVIDYKKLNEFRRIHYIEDIRMSSAEKFIGEGIKEYSSEREKKLNVKVAGGVKGFSFSSETDWSFKKDEYNKTGYKFATLKQVIPRGSYTVQGHDEPGVMMDFLNRTFLEDLNTKTADEFVARYGTHVVLGMVMGGTLLFNMSYRQSILKRSEATAWSTTNTVTYDHSGNAKKPAPKPTEAESIAQKLFNQIGNETGNMDVNKANAYANLIKALSEYIGKTSGSTPNQSGSTPNQSGSTPAPTTGITSTVSYAENMKNALMEEDSTTKVKCKVIGGNAYLASAIQDSNDLTKYGEWAKSVEEHPEFADFVPGYLVPIYELVPAGYKLTARDIEAATSRYQYKFAHSDADKCIKGVKLDGFNTLGSSNTEELNEDKEVSTQPGKPIYWKLRIEFMNFDVDEGKCGYGISLLVCEGGRDANRTRLLNHITVMLDSEDCSSMAIDTSHPSLKSATGSNKLWFEASATWEGRIHGWQDATEIIRNSPDGMRRVLDCDNSKVWVYLDNDGDDLGHVGVKGVLKIPWIGY